MFENGVTMQKTSKINFDQKYDYPVCYMTFSGEAPLGPKINGAFVAIYNEKTNRSFTIFIYGIDLENKEQALKTAMNLVKTFKFMNKK